MSTRDIYNAKRAEMKTMGKEMTGSPAPPVKTKADKLTLDYNPPKTSKKNKLKI